jgi:hypothetical protein
VSVGTIRLREAETSVAAALAKIAAVWEDCEEAGTPRPADAANLLERGRSKLLKEIERHEKGQG